MLHTFHPSPLKLGRSRVLETSPVYRESSGTAKTRKEKQRHRQNNRQYFQVKQNFSNSEHSWMMSGNFLVTSEVLYSSLKFYILETISACQVPQWHPEGFPIVQGSSEKCPSTRLNLSVESTSELSALNHSRGQGPGQLCGSLRTILIHICNLKAEL